MATEELGGLHLLEAGPGGVMTYTEYLSMWASWVEGQGLLLCIDSLFLNLCHGDWRKMAGFALEMHTGKQ